MPPPAAKKKSSGKTASSPPADQSPTEPSQSVQPSGPLPSIERSPPLQPAPSGSTQELSHPPADSHLHAQITQDVSNILGATVQLSDSQFQVLLERLERTPGNLYTHTSPEPQVPPRTTRQRGPDRSPSGGSSPPGSNRGSRQGRIPRPRRSRPSETPASGIAGKRSPKHEDPPQLDDGTSPTYAAWKALLRGKLRKNADWWVTEQERIDYVFSRTTGEAQRHLEPRIDEKSLDPWASVDEMLDHLDTCFRNYFEAEQSENAFYALKQSTGQDFNDFHTEFSRLASVGRVPAATWRSHLWRKLNREFQNRLLATHRQHPTYEKLVRECQRLSVDLEEFHRQFPTVTSKASRQSTIKTSGLAATRQLPSGVLPSPRFGSPAPPRASPFPDQRRDSASPKPSPPSDPAKATCFRCGKEGHLAKACPDPRSSPRILEIEQEDVTPGNDEADDKSEATSESDSEN
jgi:hypothetical protein